MDTCARIVDLLTKALVPERIDVIDESQQHRGHVGAGAGGHYRLEIVSRAFEGMSRIERQRAVYGALAGEMGRTIHALSMRALVPGEGD